MQQATALKALLLLSAAVITAPAAWAFNGCRAADVTHDGRVDEADRAALEGRLGNPCPRGDLDGSGLVDSEDLKRVERFLGVDCSTWCPADFNDDGTVDMEDRNLLVPVLGQDCTDPDECPFDVNGDLKSDTTDLFFVLASHGRCGSLPTPTFLPNPRGDPPNSCAEDPEVPETQ